MASLIKIILPLTFLIVFLIPGFTFFEVNKDATLATLGSDSDSATKMFTLFRLFGLYAITFIWGQMVLGPFMRPLIKIYGGRVLRFHRAEGVFALLFATLHPILFYLAYILSGSDTFILFAISDYFGYGPLTIYGYLGPIAWTLMFVTVLTALFMRHPLFTNIWRKIHFLNYLVFIFGFVHSFKIGTETQLDPMRTLYIFFAITYIAALCFRFIPRIKRGYLIEETTINNGSISK